MERELCSAIFQWKLGEDYLFLFFGLGTIDLKMQYRNLTVLIEINRITEKQEVLEQIEQQAEGRNIVATGLSEKVIRF